MTRLILLLVVTAALAVGCASRSGDDLALSGNLAGAMDAYAQEDSYESHLKMGLLHQTQGDHADAVTQFSLAAALNTEADYRVYQYRAESYLASNNQAKARADLDEALRRNPRVAEIHFLLGNLHLQQNQLEEASAAYTRALEDEVDNPALRIRILKNRALTYFRGEQFANAADDYEQALAGKPSASKDERFQLGLLLYAADREEEARKAWTGLSAVDRNRLRTMLDENLDPGF